MHELVEGLLPAERAHERPGLDHEEILVVSEVVLVVNLVLLAPARLALLHMLVMSARRRQDGADTDDGEDDDKEEMADAVAAELAADAALGAKDLVDVRSDGEAEPDGEGAAQHGLDEDADSLE